jgi:ATP-dependent exoDNAse (exonuclease V) beta subunit
MPAYAGNRIAEKLCRGLFKSRKGLNDRWTAEQLKNLVYVGMTRARYRLIIPYFIENETHSCPK